MFGDAFSIMENMRFLAHIFLLVTSTVACGQEAGTAFQQARRLQQAGQWSDAERAYKQYVKLHGATPEALANLGAVLVHEEKYEEAISKYRAALKLAPKLTPIRMNLGLAYLKSGNRALALQQFTAYLREDPGNRQVMQLRAMTLLDLERFAEAAKDYSTLMPTDDVSVIIGLATAYLRLEQPAEARQALEPLLARDSAEAELLLAQALIADGRVPEARSALEQAQRLNPKLPSLHFHLGAIYWKQQDTDAAIAEWRKELEADPAGFQPNYTLGAALALSSADAKEAEMLLRKAIAVKPRNATALYQLAKLVWQRSKSEEAISLLDRSVQVDPRYREAHYLLGTVYQTLGRKQEAAREFALIRRLSESEVKRTRDIFESVR